MTIKNSELDLLKKLKEYSQNELYHFSNGKSKEQMNSEIKSLYEKYGVDPNKSHNFSQLDELQQILSRNKSHPNEMAERLYQKKNQKLEAQNNKSNNKDNEVRNKHRSFTVCLDDLKNYSDEQLASFYSNKLLTHGWTMDEIATPLKQGSLPCIDNSSPLRNFSVNIEGLTVLDAYVKITKNLIQIYVFKKDPVQILNDASNIAKKWNENENFQEDFTSNPDNNLQGLSSDFESDTPVQDEQYEQNSEPEIDDDALTEEDIRIRDEYGVDVNTHSGMVDFLNSEEWQQIQSMMSNTLSRNDSIPH